MTTPSLIPIGEKGDWTPIDACRKFVVRLDDRRGERGSGEAPGPGDAGATAIGRANASPSLRARSCNLAGTDISPVPAERYVKCSRT